jgi:hypothetical protein
VQKTPKNALNASIEYRDQLAGGTQWFTELNASYRSERFLDEANLSTLPSYTLVDLRAGFAGQQLVAHGLREQPARRRQDQERAALRGRRPDGRRRRAGSRLPRLPADAARDRICGPKLRF